MPYENHNLLLSAANYIQDSVIWHVMQMTMGPYVY